MVRSTPKSKKPAQSDGDKSHKTPAFGTGTNSNLIGDVIKAYAKSGFTVPSFKKKAKKAKSSSSADWDTSKLLRQQELKIKKLIGAVESRGSRFSFKQRRNYTNKSSNLSNITPFKSKSIDSIPTNPLKASSTSTQNRKKSKRKGRRNQLKERIETKKDWMTEQNEMSDEQDNGEHEIEAKSLNGSPWKELNGSPRKESKTSKSIQLEWNPAVGNMQPEDYGKKSKPSENNRNRRTQKQIKEQLSKDWSSMNALFKCKKFNKDPLKFVRRKTKRRTAAMEEANKNFMMDKKEDLVTRRKGKDKTKSLKERLQRRLKGNKRSFGHSKLSDEKISEQIAEQLKVGKKKKLDDMKNTKKMLKKKRGQMKDKEGKLKRRIRQKMTQFAKDSQKRRKWRL